MINFPANRAVVRIPTRLYSYAALRAFRKNTSCTKLSNTQITVSRLTILFRIVTVTSVNYHVCHVLHYDMIMINENHL